ncbi:nuclear transport factor 2 family protein [Labilithrix luteola]
MSTKQNVMQRYIDAWNETDAGRRRAILAEVYTEDCTYTDPLAAVSGRDGIDQLIAGVQKQFPGLVFSLAGKVDTHHDQARFTWHAGALGHEPAVIGFDVAVLEGDRIRSVYGFLDKVPG